LLLSKKNRILKVPGESILCLKNDILLIWQFRKKIIASDWSGSAEFLIFDEIHKYNKWKTLIKGEYDKLKKI